MSPLVLAIAGGGGLLVLGAGAVVAVRWRALDRALRPRLRLVAAPLAGFGGEVLATGEESIFRPQRKRTAFSWLLDRVERRYPLIDAGRSVFIAIGCGLAAAAGGWFSLWFLRVPAGWWNFPVAAGAGVGGILYVLAWLQAKQTALFVRHFPEVVDQVVRLAGAGVPALEAIGEVADDAPPPVGPVLVQVRDRLFAGLDADTALRTVAARVRIPEFTMFAAVIRLQRSAGGGISDAFSNLAKTLRERRKTTLKAHASTAQTRLTLLVLTLMPVVVLVGQKFVAPQSVEILFDPERGATLLRWGVGLVVAGLLVARIIALRGTR